MLLRAATTSLFLFPLGFFMGMPFPKGTERVKELIDWGFAVNGTASVLGSVLVVLFAFNYGFNFALLSGALLYAMALFLIYREGAW